MDYVKIIARINQKCAVESAVGLEHAGVDEIQYIYEGEQDLETIKSVAGRVDIPISVRMSPNRFEDVKKVLYAGASRVCLLTEKEEVIKEVVGRFGADKISGVLRTSDVKAADVARLQEYGYGEIYLETEGVTETDVEQLQAVCSKSCLPIMLCIPDEGRDAGITGEDVKSTGIGGIVISAEHGMHAKELKQEWIKAGLKVHTFASAIPFSEFKLNAEGLIPAVVQDYKTNEVLMVAYMNEEAFQKTIETGLMTYYSRSRSQLWLKGETSGHYQYVKSLSLDCDNDTILAKVEQVGAACHTGSYSCFFKNLVKKDYKDENPLTILKEDYDVIVERKANPKDGSYTNYLFDKGLDKILKKVGEEATEMVIAAKNPDAEELKYEISDFLYHMMVLMVEKGLTWEDITRELIERR